MIRTFLYSAVALMMANAADYTYNEDDDVTDVRGGVSL
jgi:hypothetical protein